MNLVLIKSMEFTWAKVETEAGRKIEIDDTWDFVKVNEPFTRKIILRRCRNENRCSR